MACHSVWKQILRACAPLAAAGLLLAAAPLPASAQSFFELLFGGFRRFAPPPQPPSRGFADPRFDGREGERAEPIGPGVAYCVRLCDGRHFPINYRGTSSADEICRSFCPAAPTQIFSGSSIDGAVSPNGRRYSDIPNAFVYRERIVPDCTCDGRSPTGLARRSVDDDPTLRPGDIVATGSGLMAYRGEQYRSAFVPVRRASGFSPAMRRQLSVMRVAPARGTEAAAETDGVAVSRDVDRRSRAER